jgi:hypothetical protein
MNGESGNLTSGVDSAAISVPIGESDLSITYTPVTGSPIVYHVLIKRPILITNMWFEGTTVESPTNFDASTTVTVPLTPVWDVNASGSSAGYSVSVPHGVVRGRLMLTYSRVGEQSGTGQHVEFRDPSGQVGAKLNYDSVAQTGTAIGGWGTLGVGTNGFRAEFKTGNPSGDNNWPYDVFITRRGATVVPGAPIVREAAPVDLTSALVSWDPPTSDGGETIESYTVTASQVIASSGVSLQSRNFSVRSGSITDAAPGTCVTTRTSCVVTGLVTGATYTFAVTASNINGDGPSSIATSAVTILVAPSAPTAVSAVAGVNSASVSWTAPTVDGGSAITGYTATSSPGGFTCLSQSATTLNCNMTGLTSGTEYTFTVVAHNVIGSSPASTASSTVTPKFATTTTSLPSSPSGGNSDGATSATTTTFPATTTLPASTTTVASSPTLAPSSKTAVPAPSEAVVLDLPRPAEPLLADTDLVVGEPISLEYGGFVPGEFVQLIVASTPRVIASGYANSLGFIKLSGDIPANLLAGNHSLALFAPVSGRGVRQPITVSGMIAGATLPKTGGDSGLSVALNLLLIGATTLTVVRFRRRRIKSV